MRHEPRIIELIQRIWGGVDVGRTENIVTEGKIFVPNRVAADQPLTWKRTAFYLTHRVGAADEQLRPASKRLHIIACWDVERWGVSLLTLSGKRQIQDPEWFRSLNRIASLSTVVASIPIARKEELNMGTPLRSGRHEVEEA